jgi:hypothetical protein
MNPIPLLGEPPEPPKLPRPEILTPSSVPPMGNEKKWKINFLLSFMRGTPYRKPSPLAQFEHFSEDHDFDNFGLYVSVYIYTVSQMDWRIFHWVILGPIAAQKVHINICPFSPLLGATAPQSGLSPINVDGQIVTYIGIYLGPV